MKYLVSKGVAYGADRPACTETTESCLAKNRRVQLLVKER